MNMLSRIPWLWLFVWALVLHVVLIGLSFLEVFIYSVLIEPGKDQAFYEAHAAQSAPYVAIIAGFVLTFLIARLMTKNRTQDRILIGIMLAVAYMVMDVFLLIAVKVDWGEHMGIFLISFATKILAGYLGSISFGKK